MILIINVCKEKLHYYEFVRPIEKILFDLGVDFYTKHYTKFTDKDLRADKIIICGTSLKDKIYLNKIELFKWIDFYDKPILGICAGSQILSNYFKGSVYDSKEIGLDDIVFSKDFLGFKNNDEIKAYQLHKFALRVNEEFFEAFALSKGSKGSKGSKDSKNSNDDVIQAIKHKTKPFYGVLFHPEVRNKKLIEYFLSINS